MILVAVFGFGAFALSYFSAGLVLKRLIENANRNQGFENNKYIKCSGRLDMDKHG
jgi:hypothetical protein